jgi:molybdopterin-binding protein
MTPLLQVARLHHQRGDFRLAIDDFVVDRGEVMAILGPNGAGKSTLFRLLSLTESPSSGAILLDGKPVRASDESARRRISAVFQRPHLFAGTARSNVEYGLRARGLDSAEVGSRATRWMETFGIGQLAGADVRRLSGGEAQRVALARAFATEPDLLLLDEPAAALDTLARRQLLADLEGVVRDERRSVVLVTHDAAEAFALADRVALLEDGRIVQTGVPADLIASPATSFLAALTGAELLLDGRVLGMDGEFAQVELAGGNTLLALAATAGMTPGMAVHVAYRPEDVALAAPGGLEGTSLTNRYGVRVRAVTTGAGGTLIRLRLSGPPDLVALITRHSAAQLGVGPGVLLDAALKATAVRAFRAG